MPLPLETLAQIIDGEWNNIEVIFAEPWEIEWSVPPGERDDYEIHFLEKGRGRFYVGGREYSVSRGDLVFLHSMEGNSFIADESPFRFIFVTFKIEKPANALKINQYRCLLQEGCRFSASPGNIPLIQEIMYGMHREFTLKSFGSGIKMKLLLGELVFAAMERQSGRNGAAGLGLTANRNIHELVNRVIIYLQDNYGSEISLDELGRMVNLHPRYLCTVFRQVSGRTIGEFLRETRLDKAKRLLAYTSLSVTDIALEVGFGSSQYFSRLFCRFEGMDPRSFRKMKRPR